jgi:hypothetical protein
MIFNWNIDTWGKNEIPAEIRSEPQSSWIKTLLSGLKNVYNDFRTFRTAIIQQINGNSQTLVLQNILNDEFDAIQRQIRITTAFNASSPIYIETWQEINAPGSTDSPLWIATAGEYTSVYIGTMSEYGRVYDFIVEARAGSLTASQITRLKFMVNRYRFFSTRPFYQYLITRQPF